MNLAGGPAAWVEQPLLIAVGWAVIHFIWQGALLGGAHGLLQRALRRRSSDARYLAAYAVLLLMLATAVATTAWFVSATPAAPATVGPPAESIAPTAASFGVNPTPVAFPEEASGAPAVEPAGGWSRPLARLDVSGALAPALPWAGVAWVFGVALMSVRLAVDLRWARLIMREGHEPLRVAWQARLQHLAARVRVSRPVRIAESVLVETPVLVGHLRPIILLPASALTGLTTEQIEAILVHELAHVRRHDYALNLLQSVIEVLLFYHPAVWWVSRTIRREREHCCDDLVVETLGDRLLYARALMQVEQMRGPVSRVPGAAMAAPGTRDGALLRRVARLLGRTPRSPRRRGGRSAVAGLLAAAVLLAGLWGAQAWASRTDASAARAVELDTRLMWLDTTWAPDVRLYTTQAVMTWSGPHPRFSVFGVNKHHAWIRYLDLPIDPDAYPIVVMEYRAQGLTPNGAYGLFLDDGTGPNNGGLVPFVTSDLVADGKVHEIRRDLRTLKPNGAIRGLAMGVTSDQGGVGTLELRGIRFERAPEAPDAAPPADDPPIDVTVVGPGGEPVEGAVVIADFEWRNFSRVARSGPDGAARVRPRANGAGRHMIRVEKEGFITAEVAADAVKPGAPLTVRLRPAEVQGGRVLDESGAPVAGASVRFVVPPAPGEASRIRRTFSAMTDAEGRWFTPVAVPADQRRVLLQFLHPGFASDQGMRTIDGEALAALRRGDHRHVLTPGVSVRGRVVDGRGLPVTGMVRIEQLDFGGRLRSVDIAPDGRFELPRTQAGEHDLVVQADGFAPQIHRVKVSGTGLDLSFTVSEPASLLRGRVVDSDGKPINSVLVMVEDPGLYGETRTGADGSFGNVPLAPGTTVVLVYQEGYMRLSAPVDQRERERTFTLHRPLKVRARVIDRRTRQPIAGARIFLGDTQCAADPEAWVAVEPGRDGGFETQFNWVHGKHLIRAEAPGYKPVLSREIESGEPGVSLDFELEPDAGSAP